ELFKQALLFWCIVNHESYSRVCYSLPAARIRWICKENSTIMRPIKYFQITRRVLYLCWTSLLVGMLLLLAPALGAHVGAAGPAALVKDINPGPANAIAIGDRRSL